MISDDALGSVRLAWWKAKVGSEGEENWVGGGLRSIPSTWALAARKASIVIEVPETTTDEARP